MPGFCSLIFSYFSFNTLFLFHSYNDAMDFADFSIFGRFTRWGNF